MAKKKQCKEPSDCCVHDEFRSVDGGVAPISVNSKPAQSDYYVDRERLATKPHFESTKKGYTLVEKHIDLVRKARSDMGGLKFHSSNKRG